MRKIVIILLFCVFPNLSTAQIYEMGGFLGASNFIGDIGLEDYLIPTSIGGGIVFKYNVNPRIALRFNFTEIGIKGDDSNSNNLFRNKRNVSFTNNISEFAVGTEFNFFEYTLNSFYTPYILTQIAVFEYRAPKSLESINLKTKSTIGVSVPIGVGFKSRLSSNIAFAIEGGFRYTFKDDIDFTTDTIKGINFGGQGKDFYWFSGISFVYTFGRPACFAPRETNN